MVTKRYMWNYKQALIVKLPFLCSFSHCLIASVTCGALHITSFNIIERDLDRCLIHIPVHFDGTPFNAQHVSQDPKYKLFMFKPTS